MKEKLNKQLRLEESVEESAYQDSKGWWTIGVGRLIDKRKGGRLSQDEISYLLDNDIDEKTSLVFKALPWLSEHPETIQASLVQMSFQMGVDGLLGFKTTLGLIKDRKYKEAADQMLKSKWATVDSPARAKRVAEQVRTQSWVYNI